VYVNPYRELEDCREKEDDNQNGSDIMKITSQNVRMGCAL
jgi:hypothetical protein